MDTSAHHHIGRVLPVGSTAEVDQYPTQEEAIAARKQAERLTGQLYTVRPCNGACRKLSGWVG